MLLFHCYEDPSTVKEGQKHLDDIYTWMLGSRSQEFVDKCKSDWHELNTSLKKLKREITQSKLADIHNKDSKF